MTLNISNKILKKPDNVRNHFSICCEKPSIFELNVHDV